MKNFLNIFCIVLTLILSSCQLNSKKTNEKPNILFIAVDDLRPELGCYGESHIISPNIDKLANKGLVFKNAYCNVPVCGASRASLLTGMRPTKNRFMDFAAYAQEDVPNAVSLPEHFKNNGYYTISNGKVFHHINDILEGWTEEPWNPAAIHSFLNYKSDTNINLRAAGKKRGLPYDCADVTDSAYFDGQIANKTIDDLKRLKELEQPFFLATGFLKPHLPFNAPKKYWDLYEEKNIHLPNNYFRPENAPDMAIHNFGELRKYFGIPKEGPVSDEMALKLIHGYYACVSYTDAQIGKVLDALEELELEKNTVVILWGDHGWQLGEHTLWCKHANFNTSLNAPLIISVPGKEGNKKTKALVEFVDIFPTLCDLAGLEKPEQLHGKSFVPLLDNPQQEWKDAVYSRFFTGESVRTQQYLYTEWISKEGETRASMLYDHYTDPNENKNIVNNPELQETVNKLHEKLWTLKDSLENNN